jgi:hypothetical protein
VCVSMVGTVQQACECVCVCVSKTLSYLCVGMSWGFERCHFLLGMSCRGGGMLLLRGTVQRVAQV